MRIRQSVVHLLAVDSPRRCDAANALLEVLQLPLEVPVAHVGEARCVERPDALAAAAVAGPRRSTYRRRAALHVAGHARRRPRVRAASRCRRSTFSDRRVIGQHRRNSAICAPNVSPSCAPRSPSLERMQLAADVPGVLARELRCVELRDCLRPGGRGTPCRPHTGQRPRLRSACAAPASARTSAGRRASV